MSPAREAQVRAARLGISGKEAAEQSTKRAKELQRKQSVSLTESERRRIWFGSRKSALAEVDGKISNLAKVGREWLAAIGQLPDFTKILDRHGNTIGHYEVVEPELQ